MRPPGPAIRGSLATALVALATAATPAPALAAAATDAVQRIAAAGPLGGRGCRATAASLALTVLLALAPALVALALAGFPSPHDRRGGGLTMAAAGDTLPCSGLLPHRHRSQERQVSWARPSGAWR